MEQLGGWMHWVVASQYTQKDSSSSSPWNCDNTLHHIIVEGGDEDTNLDEPATEVRSVKYKVRRTLYGKKLEFFARLFPKNSPYTEWKLEFWAKTRVFRFQNSVTWQTRGDSSSKYLPPTHCLGTVPTNLLVVKVYLHEIETSEITSRCLQ